MIRSICICIICFHQVLAFPQSPKHGRLVTEKLTSEVLRENRIGLDPNRTIKIYLPPSYDGSKKSYPVVYFFPSMFTPVDQVFDNGVVSLMERAFTEGVIREFIFVAADYSSPTVGSLYENSPVSGRWIDFTVNELVPFVDNKLRTLKHRDSRAVVGHFMGGRGALKMVMSHAETFSVAYALHPVATGNGYMPWSMISLEWKKVFAAKTFDEVGNARIFVSVGQAFLPNLDRPPFYANFMFEPDAQGEPRPNPENIIKSKAGFHLEESLIESASNLRSLQVWLWTGHDSMAIRIMCIRTKRLAVNFMILAFLTKAKNTVETHGARCGELREDSSREHCRSFKSTWFSVIEI